MKDLTQGERDEITHWLRRCKSAVIERMRREGVNVQDDDFEFVINWEEIMAGKPFGGVAISFKGREETVEQVFGSKPITTVEMTKKLWAFIKGNNLRTK